MRWTRPPPRASRSRRTCEHKLVTAAQMAAANSAEFGMPVFDPAAMDSSQSALNLAKEDLLQKHAVLPLFKRGGKLFVGTADPTNTHALDEIKFHTNLVVEPILVDEDAIRINLERWLQAADAFGDALDDAEGLENLDIDSGAEEKRDAGADGKQDYTRIVKVGTKGSIDAIKRGASDLHFEPYATHNPVRLRIAASLTHSAKMPRTPT